MSRKQGLIALAVIVYSLGFGVRWALTPASEACTLYAETGIARAPLSTEDADEKCEFESSQRFLVSALWVLTLPGWVGSHVMAPSIQRELGS